MLAEQEVALVAVEEEAAGLAERGVGRLLEEGVGAVSSIAGALQNLEAEGAVAQILTGWMEHRQVKVVLEEVLLEDLAVLLPRAPRRQGPEAPLQASLEEEGVGEVVVSMPN